MNPKSICTELRSYKSCNDLNKQKITEGQNILLAFCNVKVCSRSKLHKCNSKVSKFKTATCCVDILLSVQLFFDGIAEDVLEIINTLEAG